MKVRLDKYLSQYGLGTRKEVKKLIRTGIVTVDDEIIKKDDYKIDTDVQVIKVNDKQVSYSQYVYIMMNKPQGYVCATEDQVHETVLDLIYEYDHYPLFPVGRLDKDTEGLLLLTNDGDFAHKLTSPHRHHPKVYYALCKGKIGQEAIQQFEEGISIGDYRCKSAHLKILKYDQDNTEIELEIFEGKFHQVKRMIQAIDSEVLFLKRISIKNLQLDPTLQLGEYRELSQAELVDLLKDL